VAYLARKETQPTAEKQPSLSFLDRLASYAPVRKLPEAEIEARKARAAATTEQPQKQV
jgi:hypothetical protein